MNAEDLLDEWNDGMRPERVQQLRDDIREHTGLPVPRRLPEVESWLDRMKSQVTRKLRKKASTGDEEPSS